MMITLSDVPSAEVNVIPPNKFFEIFETNLHEFYSASGTTVAIDILKRSQVYQKLVEYAEEDDSWDLLVGNRLDELAQRDYDHRYQNPHIPALIAYLTFLKDRDPEAAQHGARLLVEMDGDNLDFMLRAVVEDVLGPQEIAEVDVVIDVKKLHPEWKPHQGTASAAGVDLYALFPGCTSEKPGEGVKLMPGQRELIPLGCALAIPDDWFVEVSPRSGLAKKHGVTLINAPGIIDPDYRGEMGAILVNLSDEPFHVTHGMRICQIIPKRRYIAAFNVVDELPETERGEGGFGSTGTS